jgi:hypothetical protein
VSKDTVFRTGDCPLFWINAQIRGIPVNLAGYTVNFLFKCGDGVEQAREATITDPDHALGGLAEYRLLSTDLVVPAEEEEVDLWWEWALIDALGNPSGGPPIRRHGTVIPRLAAIPAPAGSDFLIGFLLE